MITRIVRAARAAAERLLPGRMDDLVGMLEQTRRNRDEWRGRYEQARAAFAERISALEAEDLRLREHLATSVPRPIYEERVKAAEEAAAAQVLLRERLAVAEAQVRELTVPGRMPAEAALRALIDYSRAVGNNFQFPVEIGMGDQPGRRTGDGHWTVRLWNGREHLEGRGEALDVAARKLASTARSATEAFNRKAVEPVAMLEQTLNSPDTRPAATRTPSG